MRCEDEAHLRHIGAIWVTGAVGAAGAEEDRKWQRGYHGVRRQAPAHLFNAVRFNNVAT